MAHKQAQEISGTPMTPRCYRNSSFIPKEGCEVFFHPHPSEGECTEFNKTTEAQSLQRELRFMRERDENQL